MLTVFMGYDDREDVAYKVAEYSLKRRASLPLEVVPLRHKALRARHLFRREWTVDADGQYWDKEDGKPFSTQFSHSRFLTPELARRNELDWAVFVDCDFLFIGDIFSLVEPLQAAPTRAIWVHKRESGTVPEGTKMDGIRQEAYRRKLWSSFMVFNMKHPALASRPSIEEVNTASGEHLHSFGWLKDEEIGAFYGGWNYIPQFDCGGPLRPQAIHYSVEAPWFEGQENCLYAKEWRQELEHMTARRKIIL